MITEATLYLAGREDARMALAIVAGHPLAFRMLMAAVRAGCRRVWVPAIFRGGAVERAIAAAPSARAAAAWLDAGTPPPQGPTLLLPVAALVPATVLRPLVAAPATAMLAPSEGDAPVVAAAPGLVRALWGAMAAGQPVGEPLARALGRERVGSLSGPGWYLRVGSAEAATAAERHLYAGLGSVIDTRLDTVFHRRLSRPLSRLAVACRITPNQLTFLSLLVGLGAAWCFWQATPVSALVGLALYVVAVVLDHADGEVARLTYAESEFGAWFDVAVDTVVHALLVAAMGVTAQRAAGGAAALFGAIAALGVVAVATVTKTSPRAPGGLGRVLDALSNRDGFYAMLVAFILGLAFLPALLPVLMLVVAAGAHAFWLGRLAYWVCRLGRLPRGRGADARSR